MLQPQSEFNPLEVSTSLDPSAGLMVFPFVVMLLHGIIAIGCAVGIHGANARVKARGDKVQIITPWTWVLAGLLGSVVSVAIYWVMHESTLVRRKE